MELSEEQRSAVRWQWWLVAGMLILWLLVVVINALLSRYISDLVPLQNGLFSLFNCASFGLTNLMIGILSVRYRVSIYGRRLKSTETVEGKRAVMLGWVGIIGGMALTGAGFVWSYESGAGPLIYLGCLFVLLMLWGIIYGLRSGLGRRDPWN